MTGKNGAGAVPVSPALAPLASGVAPLFADKITPDVILPSLYRQEGVRVEHPREKLDGLIVAEPLRALLTRLAARHEDYVRLRAQHGLDDAVSYGLGTVLLFRGPPGTGKTLAARAMAGTMGKPLVVVAGACMHCHQDRLAAALDESRRQNGILFLDEVDDLGIAPGSDGERQFLDLLERATTIVILATNRAAPFPDAVERRILYRVSFDLPDRDLRRRVWRRHVPPSLGCPPEAIDEVSGIPWLAGGHIKNAALAALQVATAESEDPVPARVTVGRDHLYAAALEQYERIERNLGATFRLPLPAPGAPAAVPAPFQHSRLEDLAALLPNLIGERGRYPEPAVATVGLVAADEDVLVAGAAYLAARIGMPLVVSGVSRHQSRIRDSDEDRITSFLAGARRRFVGLVFTGTSSDSTDFSDAGPGLRLVAHDAALMVLGAFSPEALRAPCFANVLAVVGVERSPAALSAQDLDRAILESGSTGGRIDTAAVLREAGGSIRRPAALCQLARAHAATRGGAAVPTLDDFLVAARLQREPGRAAVIFGKAKL